MATADHKTHNNLFDGNKKKQKQQGRKKAQIYNAPVVAAGRKNGKEHFKASQNNNGTRGANVRSAATEPLAVRAVAQMSPGSLVTLAVSCPVSTRSISYLAMGIVLRGLKSGSASAQITTECPYYQFRYLIDVFTSVMQSSTMLLTVAPTWMWELLYALKPKERPCKTGYVNYSWVIEDDGLGTDQNFVLGTGEDNYSVFWGTGVTGLDVNGFPVLGAIAGYTEALGKKAISALWPYVTEPGEHLSSDPGEANVITGQDTSAFAVVYPELGETYSAEGAVRTTIYSERHIDSPLFAQFSKYQEAGQSYWRGWNESRVGSGSPSIIGPVLMANSTNKAVRNKTAPILKFYNFDEFFEQLCLTMTFAADKMFDFQLNPPTCPMTEQEVAILLRQAILQVCNNELAQDVRYSGTQFVDLLPFTVGPNGSLGGGSIDMLVPTFIGENIRAIASTSVKLSKKFANNLAWYPILARPPSQPLPGPFVYGVNSTPLFTGAGSMVPINIIDCSAIQSQNTVYLDLSRTAIQTLVETWNTWITNFSAYLSPLICITSEQGLRAVNCNTYTNICEVVPPVTSTPVIAGAPSLAKKKSSADIKSYGLSVNRLRLTENAAAQSSYFLTSGDRKITSVSGFSRPLDQVMDNWVLPVSYSVDPINDASTQGYQAFMAEQCSKPRSSAGGIGSPGNTALSIPLVYDRHRRAAMIDVKVLGTADQQNEIIGSFVELSKKGRGGFLSSALAGIANMFMPGMGSVVGGVADGLGL